MSAPNEIAFQRPSRLAAGVALSLLLHAAILFAWRLHAPPRADERPVRRSIAVWLRPPVKVEPAPVAAAAPAASA
ncbi:MAG: hypothetical protein JWN73_2242, partial [Betaproteobacteria bacterium]|nr:hypothetical protein [Betaproteobacteria bacterium]